MVPTPHRHHRIRHPLQPRRSRDLGRGQGSSPHPLGHLVSEGRSWGHTEKPQERSQRHCVACWRSREISQKLHPRDEEAAERHAVDAFFGALDKNLVMEVQKLGHWTIEEVVAAARRIEKILEEQTDSNIERLVSSMQDHIRILNKDLKKANEQIAAHKDVPQPQLPWPLSLLQPQQSLLPPKPQPPLLHATLAMTMGIVSEALFCLCRGTNIYNAFGV